MRDTQRAKVLTMLREGDVTASQAALVLGVKEPSVRRIMQELRAEGYLVNFGSGVYRMISTTTLEEYVHAENG